MDSEKIMDAIRELRKSAEMSQTTLAVTLGISLPTIQRYEGQKAPQPEALAQFYRFAIDNGRLDLALFFRDAALDRLSLDFVEMVKDDRQQQKEKATKQGGIASGEARKRA